MEVGRLGADPGDEAGQLGVGAQALGVGQAAGDLGFGVAGVDGAVADLVQPHRPQPIAAACSSQPVSSNAGPARATLARSTADSA